MNLEQNQRCDLETEEVAKEITDKDIEFKSFIGYETRNAKEELTLKDK